MTLAQSLPGLPSLRRRLLQPVQAADIVAVSCIVMALWIVYFRALPYLGLYNDDYYNVGYPASLSFGEVWSQCLSWLTRWPNGRPLSACFGWLSSYILVHLAGLQAIYLVPFFLLSANSLLIYYIVSRKTQPLAGFIAGVSFAISPVDTLRLQLTGAFFYQACIMLTLIAFVLYDRARYTLAYVSLFIGLLFHECAILGFVAAPILSAHRGEIVKRFVKNLVIIGCIVTFVLYLRAETMGESRANAAMSNVGVMLQRSVTSAMLGSLTHLRLLSTRAMQSLTSPMLGQVAGTLAWLVVLLGAGMGVILAGVEPFRRGRWREIGAALKAEASPATVPWGGYARVFAAGAVIFWANYLVFFLSPYYPANHIAGMIALVHTAPGVGASLCLAVLLMALIAVFTKIELRIAGLAAVLLYLSALGAWGAVVREQYVDSWRNQKAFWKSMVALVPDATDGTVIIVQTERTFDLPYTWVIGSNSWADAVVPRMLYRCSWNSPPMAYVFDPSWVNMLQNRNGEIGWIRPASLGIPGWETLSNGNLVMIVASYGQLTRQEGNLKVPQGVLRLKPAPPPGTVAKLADGVISRAILH